MEYSRSIQMYISQLVEETVREVLGNQSNSGETSGRQKLIVANWKMNMSLQTITSFVEKLTLAHVRSDVVICPSFPYLFPLSELIQKFNCDVELGAQDLHWNESGAYTGEVSAKMLLEADCHYVLIGHSERRDSGETDEMISKKVKQAISSGLKPILCVGESQGQRQIGKTAEVIRKQVLLALEGIEDISSLVIAYEPVWAIGTGLSATPEQAQSVHQLIRKTIDVQYGSISESIPLLYGGSVKPENASGLSAMTDIDGALVGGASLDAESFAAIIRGFERG
ncbi:triose-phosphate isomerase [Evansella tamaricis]|uniref:Triosephosphate isomerase n=1 Tax=Evansella tamaricis TaxID=2069301 RepID=A0ABS6JE90_9BACI|nr:triose-phosphate isomerase [Evansella tamaricis]MBU9711966.1 triose-phosphate isomerase [Evansella tamaricis]